MPKYLLVNGRLSLTSFKVDRRTTSGWRITNDLNTDEDYRFRFRFFNDWPDAWNSGAFEKIWFRLEWVWDGPRGSKGWVQYYSDDSYTGAPARQIEKTLDYRLRPQRGRSEYVYFRWRGPEATPIPQVQVRMTFRALEVILQPYFHPTPLVPNVR